MKRILMTLLCLVGLTGLAGSHEFDTSKFAFAEGFTGGTLNQDALVLQITDGKQLKYFKAGETRPDGKVIGQSEEGFYAAFTMGWNTTTWAYATPGQARFQLGSEAATYYTGEEVQNGRLPGLSIATKTAATTYVTSFTYWARVEPTQLVQGQTYKLPLWVWSNSNILDHYWNKTMFEIQILVSESFMLTKPDGEQVFPVQTMLFEKLRGGHIADYENMSYCGNVQKAYEKAIAEAEARAKQIGGGNADVEAFIKMESDCELDPSLILAPKYGKIVFNLNGHHLTLKSPLPNAGCIYEFRDTKGKGLVESMAEGGYLLSEYKGPSHSPLIIHGGSYACLPFTPDNSSTVKIFNGSIVGQEFVNGTIKQGQWNFAARGELTKIAVDELNYNYITYETHVHSWRMWPDGEVMERFKGAVDTNTCVVVSCNSDNCPLRDVNRQDFFILHLAQAGDSITHQYPFNIRYFNGTELPMGIYEDEELTMALLQQICGREQKMPYTPFLQELEDSAGVGGYAASVSATAGVYANDRDDLALDSYYIELGEALAKYNEGYYTILRDCVFGGKDFGQTLRNLKVQLTDLNRVLRQTTDEDLKTQIQVSIKQVQAEYAELQKNLLEAILKVKEDPATREKFLKERFEFIEKGKDSERNIQQSKAKLRDARGNYYQVANAPIYNPGRYDIFGALYINDISQSEPSERHITMSNDAEILPLPLMGENGSKAFEKDGSFRLYAVLSPGETPVPYTGEAYQSWIVRFEYLVNGRLANDWVPDAGSYQENFVGDDRAEWYAKRGLTVISGDEATNPGTYAFEVQADHAYNVEMARQGASVRPHDGWCDPFFGYNGKFCFWTILDAPVMVQDNDHNVTPYLTLQDAAAALKGEDVTVRITQDLFNDGRADHVTVPKKYGLLDLGGTCGLFTLDLQGRMIGAEAEPGAFTCIINNGKMAIIDTMTFNAVNVGAAAAAKDEKAIAELAKKEVTALVGNKLLSTGTVYGQVINNGTMTIGTEPLLLASGALGEKYRPGPAFNDTVQNHGTMTVLSGAFKLGLWNVAGTVEIRGGVFEGPIVDDADGVSVYGGMFSKDMSFDELQAMLAPGYQIVDEGDYYAVVPHKHVYELEMIPWPGLLQANGLQGFNLGGAGFTLTCTNDPICLVRKGEFRMKDPGTVNKDYDREPLDAVPFVCTITDDVTGEQREVSLADFLKAFDGVLSQTSPVTFVDSETKEEFETPPVNAGHYEAGLTFVASNTVVKIDELRGLKKSQGVAAISAYQIKPVELTSVELNESEFKYDGSVHNITKYRGGIYAGSLLIDDEFNYGKECVVEAVGSPFEVCEYPFIVEGKDPNTYGTVTNWWRILPPSGNFADKAATEANEVRMGANPCGYIDGNPIDGFSLFVTDSTNMVYEASSRKWLAGLTVAWPYKTALLAKDRKYTPAEDAYFLSSTDPTNLLTAADIEKHVFPASTRWEVVTGKDGISDVPGVKEFSWWVEIDKDFIKHAQEVHKDIAANFPDAYKQLQDPKAREAAIAELGNVKKICEFVAEGLEKDVVANEDVTRLNELRECVGANRIVSYDDTEALKMIALVENYASYVETGDKAAYLSLSNQWTEVFSKDAMVIPQTKEDVEKVMNAWAAIEFKPSVKYGGDSLTTDVRFDSTKVIDGVDNLFVARYATGVTYTLTAWGVAGAHSADGVKATDFNVVIDLDNFELVEDDLADAEVALEGDESFIAEKAAYNFDRNAHFVTVPEKITLGINTLTKGVDFEVTGENVKQKGSEAEDCFYTVTLKAIDGRGITGEKELTWAIIAPSGSFGEVTIANDAKAGDSEGDKYGLTFFFTDDNNPNAGLKYYTEDEATAAGLASAGWYAAVKVVVPVNGVDFMKPSQLYFTANDGSGFNANSCKDAINEYGVKSEVTEDISTWWWPCVRSFTWWTRIDEADVKAATDAGLTSITNTISAYGLAWSETKNLVTVGSDGIRRHEYKVVIDIKDIELIDADDIQHWPQHDHDWSYTLTDGTNLTAVCANEPCRQSPLTLTLVGPADKVYDGTPSVATLVGDKPFAFYTGSKLAEHIMYSYSTNNVNSAAEPVNAGEYIAKLFVRCQKLDTIEATDLECRPFKIFAQETEPGEITAVLNKETFDYTGSALKPAVTVAYKGKTLKSGVDYTLSGDLEGVGSGSTNTVYEITVSSAVNYVFEPITLTWTVRAPKGSFTDVARASADLGGELEDNTLAFEPVDEDGVEVLNSGLVYFTAEEAMAANAGDTAGWYAGLTVKLPVSTWTFTTPGHLLFTYYGEQILGSACPYQTVDGLRLTLDTGVTAGGIGNYTYVNSFSWWERIDLDEIEAARAPFIHYPEVATNLTELAKATTFLGEVALPKSAGWYVTRGDFASAKKYCDMVLEACGGNPLVSVTAQTVTDICEIFTGYADYLAAGDEDWYNTYSNFMIEVAMMAPDQVRDPQYVFAKIPEVVAREYQFENKEDGGMLPPLVTKFDAAKLDEDCTTIMAADSCLEIAKMMELNVISREIKAAATTWSGKVIGIDTYGDKNGIAEQTFRMEVDVNELSTFWDNEGHRFYPPHDHQYKFEKRGGGLLATCEADGACPYPELQLWLKADTSRRAYDGNPLVATLVASNVYVNPWREMSVEAFCDYTKSAPLSGIIYEGVMGCSYGPVTNEPPSVVGMYSARVAVESMTGEANSATNVIKTTFVITAQTLANCTVSLSGTSFQWDGKTHSVSIQGVYNGAFMLDEGFDYEIDYEHSVFEAAGEEGKDMSYPIIVSAIEGGNYTGVATNWWTVATGEAFYDDVISGKTYLPTLEAVLNRDSVKSPVDAFLGKSYATAGSVTVNADWLGRTKVLDLNGKTVVYEETGFDFSFLENKGVLTITDSVGGGLFSNTVATAALIRNSGTLTIEAGTFIGRIDNTGKIAIRGGAFSADPSAYLATGYAAELNQDDNLWHVTPHVHAYTFQQITAEGAVLTGECFTNAVKRIACAERVVKAELTAEDKVYDGVPAAATLVFSAKESVFATEWKTIALEKYVELTGAVIGETSYSRDGATTLDPILPPGNYQAEVEIIVTNTVAITGEKEEKSFTLKTAFTITGADFDEVEVVTAPDVADAIAYTGETVEIGISAFLDVGTKYPYELEEGVDYTVEGVTATNRIGTYTFKVVPDGERFTGDAQTFTWSIVEPNGEFAADALGAAVADGAPAYAEVVEGTNLVITATTNLWYDAEIKCWLAGFEIAWPYDIEQVLRAPTYTDPAHAFVEFSTTNGVFSIADFAEGKVEIEGFDAFADQFYRIKHGRNETYVKGVEWIVPFTFDTVTNALENGETELSYTISVMSPAWENNKSGLKRTTYKITLPLDENLVLVDDQGRQLYPVHAHEWEYELSADDGVVANRLTATCGAADCPQDTLTVALVAEGGTEKEYDGEPLAVTLAGAEEFAVHTGATFGRVNYETEDGLAVNGVPSDAGVYFAKATVSLPDGTTRVLKLKFSIGERDLHKGYIELKGGSAYDYTGYAIDVDEDAMKVIYLGQTLVKDKDYTVDAESVFRAIGSGVSNETYKITVEGLGNYTNTLSFYWTILAPNGSFGRTDKAAGFAGGEFADATTLVLTNANEVNYGLKYYTADEAPDGSGEAGWYAGIKVDVPHATFDYTPASKMFFNDVDLGEIFSGEACPYDGVSLAISQVIYKYVTSFTWWTRITAQDVIDAEGEDIVRTLKATGLAWKDGAYGSAGLAEKTYRIVVKTEDLVLFDDRGVQLYPHHDHIWSYQFAESAIRATCLAVECPVVACELNFPPVVHEQTLGKTAADDTKLLGAEAFRLHVGATFGGFVYFDLAGEEIDAPTKVGEYAVAVDVMLPEQDGSLSTNTLATTVSVVKTAGRDFEKGALEPYDFKDGNKGGYGTVVDGTSVVVTDSTKFAYDPSNATWYAGVFVKMPNGLGAYSTDKDVFLSVSTAEGIHYADKVAAGEALTNEFLEVKDETVLVTYTHAIGWAVPLTIADVLAAREAGETEIVRSITVGANSREATVSPIDLGDSTGVKATTFNLVIPLETLVLVDENGNEVWPGALRVGASGVVTYPKANASTGLLREKSSSSWSAKANLGSVFGHWEWVNTNGPAPAAFLALSENERKKATLTVKVAAGEQVRPTDFAAVWYRLDEDTFGEVTLTPSNLVTESKSYVTATVSGLPSGMKFTAKSLTITGAPKKAQTKTVKVSLKNASGYTFKQSYALTVGADLSVALTPVDDQVRTGVAVLTWADPTLGVNPALGKTTGAKVYTAGRTASIRATPAKGEIFLGWYTDPVFANAATNLPKGYLTASQSVVVPAEGLELFARYVKLETWTVGTFDGVYFMTGDESTPTGKVTLTVSSAGKVSGKTTFGGKTYSFSSVAFDDFIVEDGIGFFTAHVVENTLKRALTIRVWCDAATGLGNASIDYGTDEDAPWAIAVQNGWKLKPAMLPKVPTGSAALAPLTADGLTFKFNANGAVGVSGKLNGTTVSASQSSQLLPTEIAVPELDGAPVTLYADICVYVAPNKTKLPAGFCKIYPVKLTYQNGVFTSVAFDTEEE